MRYMYEVYVRSIYLYEFYISQDLATFGERVLQLHDELDRSEVYGRECSLGDSWVIIDSFVGCLDVLENEAQDLIELQDLLETSVVNFSILPQCRHDLTNLKDIWETVRCEPQNIIDII